MRYVWRPKPGDVVVRHPRLEEIRPIKLRIQSPKVPNRGFTSPFLAVYGFSLLIAIGTVLLLLPFSTQSGHSPGFMTAFFTAASAVTVTGLTMVDTAEYWSFAGKLTIMLLILIGGLGFVTLTGFLIMVAGQRITLPQRLVLRDPLGVTQIGGIIRVNRNVVLTFLALQMVGAAVLAYRFSHSYGWGDGVWQGVFHSVSAFNNAGFNIFPGEQGFSALQGDYFTLATICILIILGGLGYFVIFDLARHHRWTRLSLDTKIVLLGSVVLLLVGGAILFGSEYTGQTTLGPMSVGEKAMNAFFHSVSARTAGFATISLQGLLQANMFLLIGLMFIGTASASAGGGIRLNTVGVLVATVVSSVKGREHVTAFHREISERQVHRALAVMVLALLLVFLVAFILSFTENAKFIEILFETISAFGTVGLSTGITPDLSTFGSLVIILTMFIGRVGPITLMLALTQREKVALYRPAQERVRIG